MTGLVEIGRLNAATDQMMAYEINRPSLSQSAVDARIAPVAADIINSDPTIKQAVKNGVADAAADGGFLTQQQLGAVRTVTTDHPLYSEVRLSHDFRVAGGVLRAGGIVDGPAGAVAYAVPTGDGLVELTRDFRRALPGGGADGMLPPVLVASLSESISATAPLTGITCWGDSMTMDYGSIGTAFAVELGTELGIPANMRGYSGETGYQIAWRAGAFEARITVSGALPATGAVAATITPDVGWFRERTFDGVVTSITGARVPVRIVQAGAAAPGDVPTWTVAQVGGTAPVTILPGARVLVSTGAERAVTTQPMTVWIGRNDADPDRIERALTALLTQHRDPLRRRVVLPVFNRTTEPSGSAAYVEVTAANARIAEVAGDDFYDLRADLILSGLAIVGLTPTAEDTTAMSEDRVPPALMHDVTHLNALGRQAAARLVANEIKTRNW